MERVSKVACSRRVAEMGRKESKLMNLKGLEPLGKNK